MGNISSAQLGASRLPSPIAGRRPISLQPNFERQGELGSTYHWEKSNGLQHHGVKRLSLEAEVEPKSLKWL
jgi:hypothetical protein